MSAVEYVEFDCRFGYIDHLLLKATFRNCLISNDRNSGPNLQGKKATEFKRRLSVESWELLNFPH